MTDFDDYDLQYQVNKLIAQGINEGKLTLPNGQEYLLRTNDILRLITLAKSSKLAFANVTPSGSLVPDDFIIPTLNASPEGAQSPQKPIPTDTDTPGGDVSQKPKPIDFAELERQINKKNKP